MRKSKFTESQIVATLKQVEGGRQVKDVCRDMGISEATFYARKSKYDGMEASDVHRLRDPEAEYSATHPSSLRSVEEITHALEN
ncbi:putative transposase [Luteibacter sp. W1I16]